MRLLRVLRFLAVLLFGLLGRRLSIANVRAGELREVWFTLALPAAFFVFSPNFFGMVGLGECVPSPAVGGEIDPTGGQF